MRLELVAPSAERLPAYAAALEAGWSPNTTRDVSAEELAMIRADPVAALRHIAREEGGLHRMADGQEVPWLPGRVFWIWDGSFCGGINLRHLPGTEDLPPHISGHVGYAVVPWKQRRGYATQALRLLLPVAAAVGLRRILVTCDVGNLASRRVIEANGGVFLDQIPASEHGGLDKLRYWVATG